MRRSLLKVLLLAVGGFCMAAPAVQLNVRDLPQYGVTVIPPTDPNFHIHTKTLLAGEADFAVQTAEPFAVVIQNNSGQDLLAYAIRWSWTDKKRNGKVTVNDAFFHDLGTPGAVNHRVPPGGMAFVSPFFAFVRHARTIAITPRDMERVREMATQSEITISLDSLLFADGRLVGPDEANSYSQALAKTVGEPAISREVLAKHSSGQTDPQILEWLRSVDDATQHQDSSDKSGQAVNWNKQFQAHTARILMALYRDSGPADFYQYATAHATRQYLAITRVPYDDK